MKTSWLIGIGLLAYGLSLILQLPAAQLITWADVPGLQAYGLQGQAINGQASLVQWRGWRFEHVTWDWRPVALLAGKLEANVAFHGSDNQGHGRVGMDLTQNYYLADLSAQLPVTALAPLWQPLPLRLAGRVDAAVEQVVWSKNGLVQLAGQLQLKGAAWENNPPLPLGNYTLTLENHGGNAAGTLTSPEGPLEIHGQLGLDRKGSWQITGHISPRPEASPSLRQALTILGPADREGKIPITYN